MRTREESRKKGGPALPRNEGPSKRVVNFNSVSLRLVGEETPRSRRQRSAACARSFGAVEVEPEGTRVAVGGRHLVHGRIGAVCLHLPEVILAAPQAEASLEHLRDCERGVLGDEVERLID